MSTRAVQQGTSAVLTRVCRYKQFLAEQRHTTKDDARLLRQFWIDKTDADPQEKFLREYGAVVCLESARVARGSHCCSFIINKAWIDKDGASIPTYDEIVAADAADEEGAAVDVDVDADEDVDEEDDALDALQDTFEHAYNFRFEEPCARSVPAPLPQCTHSLLVAAAQRS